MEPKVPEFGRFAEPSLLILVSLSDGPKHGYAIMQDVEAGTGPADGRRHPLRGARPARGAGLHRTDGAGRSTATLSPDGGRRVEPRGTAPRAFRVRAKGPPAARRDPAMRSLLIRLLSRPLAGPLRRRVRGDPRGTSAWALRRGRHPPRRPRRPPPPARTWRRIRSTKGFLDVASSGRLSRHPRRGALPGRPRRQLPRRCRRRDLFPGAALFLAGTACSSWP